MTLIYFMQRRDGTGPIKIGCTSFVDDRRKQLSSDYRADLVVLATAPGDFLTERNIHLKFAAIRVEPLDLPQRASPIPGRSEWYAPQRALLRFIKSVASTGTIPLTKAECREKIFAERYLAGATLQQIGDDFGVTRERVRQVLRRIGVPSLGHRPEHCPKAKPLTASERAAIKAYAKGERPKDICERFGIAWNRLNALRQRAGLQSLGAGYWLTKGNDAEITAKVCHLYREGRSPDDIVAEVPELRHPQTIYRYLKKGGVPTRTRKGNFRGRKAA